MKILKELTQIDGVSGNESDIAGVLKTFLDDIYHRVEINKTGSVIAYLNEPDPGKKTILIEAHMDRIGLVVSEICKDGFVKFKALGGVDERTLPASEIYILGKERIFGVIGALPPHLKGQVAEAGNIKISEMLIDTGLSEAELSERISIGDPIVLKSEFCELLGGRVSSAALDNRAGIYAVMKAAELLGGKLLDYNIRLAFSVGEELGLQGARCIDCKDVDLCFVVDVTHGTTPDAKNEVTFPLGSGAVICRGPNLDYAVTNKVIEIAEKQNIPYSIEVAAGNTGTNAWVIQTLEQGVKCILLSVPLKFMHTAVEVVDIEDIKTVAELIAECIKGGGLLA